MKPCAFGSVRRASSATAPESDPTTTATASVPAPRTAINTCASIDRPAIECSTFGNAERMRVPSPAASAIARQVRLLIGNQPLSVTALISGRGRLGKVHSGDDDRDLRRESLDSATGFQ